MKRYELLHSEPKLTCRNFRVFEDEVRLPNGQVCTRHVLKHPGAAVILPQQADGKFLLIRQYRHALGDSLLEFPAGTLEANEEPLACAKREICEEVGFRAESWSSLGTLFPAPGFCDELQYGYLARELSPQREQGDEDEIIEVQEFSLAEIEAAICSGELSDAKSIAFFVRAKLLGLLV